jgi:hypothetical protein
MVGVAAFVLAYAAGQWRRSWPGAIAAAYAAFVLVVVGMRAVSVGALPAFAVACASLVLMLVLLPRPPRAGTVTIAFGRWNLPFRAACTAVVVVSVTAVAPTLGPHLSGLVTAFPIITGVLAAFTHAHAGRDETTRLLRGFAVGFLSYAVFAFVVAVTIRPLGLAACFGLATVLALCTQALAVAASHRHIARPSGRGADEATAVGG